MLPQLAVLLLSASALIYAGWRLNQEFVVGSLAQAIYALLTGAPVAADVLFKTLPAGYSAELVAIAGFWALFNMLRVVAFIIKALRNARRSHAYFRFDLPLPVTLPDQSISQTQSIAEDWVRLVRPARFTITGDRLRFTLHLPDQVLSCEMLIQHQGDGFIEGRLIWDRPAQQDALAATLYSISWQREMQSHHAYFLTPLDTLGRLFGQRPSGAEPKRAWHSGLLRLTDTSLNTVPILFSQTENPRKLFEIISFNALETGLTYPLTGLAMPAIPHQLHIQRALPVASLPHPGLNGSGFWRYLAILGDSLD